LRARQERRAASDAERILTVDPAPRWRGRLTMPVPVLAPAAIPITGDKAIGGEP
jgi:hypothetical protein